MSAQHAKWLREAAEQIAKAGHNGWGNTCLDAAASIEALVADLAAERARAEREEQAHTRTIEQRDALEEQIEAVYRALGGDGEWCAKLPPEEPPDSGDLGADALALAKAATLAIAQHACSDLAMQTALAHTRAANTALRADRDRLRAAIEQAPHAWNCTYVLDSGTIIRYGVAPCNCWKADALRAAGGE